MVCEHNNKNNKTKIFVNAYGQTIHILLIQIQEKKSQTFYAPLLKNEMGSWAKLHTYETC